MPEKQEKINVEGAKTLGNVVKLFKYLFFAVLILIVTLLSLYAYMLLCRKDVLENIVSSFRVKDTVTSTVTDTTKGNDDVNTFLTIGIDKKIYRIIKEGAFRAGNNIDLVFAHIEEKRGENVAQPPNYSPLRHLVVIPKDTFDELSSNDPLGLISFKDSNENGLNIPTIMKLNSNSKQK